MFSGTTNTMVFTIIHYRAPKLRGNMTDTLELLRSKIDDINSEILELVNQRVAISLQIADIKQQKDIPLFDADREKFMLENLAKSSLIPPEKVQQLFELIFEISRTCMADKLRNQAANNDKAE